MNWFLDRLEEAGYWNPAKHPRGRLGRFREMSMSSRRGKGGPNPMLLAMHQDMDPAVRQRREEARLTRAPSPTAMTASGSPLHQPSKTTERLPKVKGGFFLGSVEDRDFDARD